MIGKARNDEGRLQLHATFVAIFLVVAHVAMIFGMLDPTLLTGQASGAMGAMPGMKH